MVRIPEHEKLKEVSEKSQVCGSFIDWLLERGFRITHAKHRTIRFNLQRELAAFFDIDEQKLEQEKDAMLKALRGREV